MQCHRGRRYSTPQTGAKAQLKATAPQAKPNSLEHSYLDMKPTQRMISFESLPTSISKDHGVKRLLQCWITIALNVCSTDGNFVGPLRGAGSTEQQALTTFVTTVTDQGSA